MNDKVRAMTEHALNNPLAISDPAAEGMIYFAAPGLPWPKIDEAEYFDDLSEAEIYARGEAGLDCEPVGVWDMTIDDLVSISFAGETYEK